MHNFWFFYKICSIYTDGRFSEQLVRKSTKKLPPFVGDSNNNNNNHLPDEQIADQPNLQILTRMIYSPYSFFLESSLATSLANSIV